MHRQSEIHRVCGVSQGCKPLGIFSHFSNTHRAITPLSHNFSADAVGAAQFVNTMFMWFEIYFEVISSKFGDALGGQDGVNTELHLEAIIERVWRCLWRPWICKLGGHGRGGLQMLMKAEIEWTQWYSWRPRSGELRDSLAGHKPEGLDMHFEAMIFRTWRR